MKEFCQTPKLVLSLEKDENKTKMQMRVWLLNNYTTILVRFFKHSPDSEKKLWDGIRTSGQVEDYILNLLYENSIVNNTDNWNYSVELVNDLQKQDEFEEKDDCLYFAWSVKPHLCSF